MLPKTNIQTFFDGKSVFITGGTGLIGNLLIEKLLRSCSGVKKLYVLVREKWNVGCEERVKALCDSPLFENIKRSSPDQLKKIVLVKGDLVQERLGINDEDWNLLKEEINCIFHVGASVKFIEPLSSALMNNVYGTYEVVKLAKETKHLESFIYVSTGYSQCNKSTVEEIFYESPFTCESLFLLLKNFGAEKLNKISTLFTENFPNTYSLSKHLSEDFLRRTAQDLPLAVIRPTIIITTMKEPIPGWTNPFHSFCKFVVAYSSGCAHIVLSKPTHVFDLIPSDIVVNQMIAMSWDVGTSWKRNEKFNQVYNCASSHTNPITQSRYEELVSKWNSIFPSNRTIWHRYVLYTTYKFVSYLFYYLQMPQMYLLDFNNRFLKKQQIYVTMYKKMHLLIGVTSYFVENMWLFKTDNARQLWNKLEEEDKRNFYFDVASIDWDTTISTTVAGVRRFILNEDTETISTALVRARILKCLHYGILLVFAFFFLWRLVTILF